MPQQQFDALLFDVGGIFLLPDPRVLGPLLEDHGGDPSIAAHRRAHYAGMAAKSAAGAAESDWHPYNDAYVRALGVPEHEQELASYVLEHTRNGVLNAHKLYCGDVVSADGKRQPFALANGILFLESDGGKQLMDDMQKACDQGSDPANRM